MIQKDICMTIQMPLKNVSKNGVLNYSNNTDVFLNMFLNEWLSVLTTVDT